MPFTIERNDLATVEADAIVIAANEQLKITGGVGLRVARAAGLELMQAACDEIGYCHCGSAVATPAFGLHARVVIHAVGPIWQGGSLGEADFLRSAYDAALACAASAGARSVALPLISAGSYGFPADVSLAVAREAIRVFLNRHDDMDVRLVLFSRESVVAGMAAYLDIAEYVDDRYLEDHPSEVTTLLNAPVWRDGRRSMEGVGEPGAHQREGGGPLPAPSAGRAAPAAPGFPAAPAPRHTRSVPARSAEPAAAQPRSSRKESDGPLKRLGSVLSERLGKRARETSEDVAAVSRLEAAEEAAPAPAAAPAPMSARAREASEDVAAASRPKTAPMPAPAHEAKEQAAESFAAPNFASLEDAAPMRRPAVWGTAPTAASPMPSLGGRDSASELAGLLDSLDAPFSTTLLALIDERGLSDVQVYKRANMSRQLFSRIRSDADYRPSKKTALALAIALSLDLDETAALLARAGFALSRSSKADVIVEYFISRGKYDIFEINEALYAFDQPIL